jgi:hypothetical protein
MYSYSKRTEPSRGSPWVGLALEHLQRLFIDGHDDSVLGWAKVELAHALGLGVEIGVRGFEPLADQVAPDLSRPNPSQTRTCLGSSLGAYATGPSSLCSRWF